MFTLNLQMFLDIQERFLHSLLVPADLEPGVGYPGPYHDLGWGGVRLQEAGEQSRWSREEFLAGNTEPTFLSLSQARAWLRLKFSFQAEPEPSSDFGHPAEPSPRPA